MAKELIPLNRPVFDQVHPNIYAAAVGLVAWFAIAAWLLFDRKNDIALRLAMVQRIAAGRSLTALVAVAGLAKAPGRASKAPE